MQSSIMGGIRCGAFESIRKYGRPKERTREMAVRRPTRKDGKEHSEIRGTTQETDRTVSRTYFELKGQQTESTVIQKSSKAERTANRMRHHNHTRTTVASTQKNMI